jgi:hypothetical protein
MYFKTVIISHATGNYSFPLLNPIGIAHSFIFRKFDAIQAIYNSYPLFHVSKPINPVFSKSLWKGGCNNDKRRIIQRIV